MRSVIIISFLCISAALSFQLPLILGLSVATLLNAKSDSVESVESSDTFQSIKKSVSDAAENVGKCQQ